MQSSHRTWQISATRADFERVSADLRSALEASALRARARHNTELVFEEIVSNVIRHGSVDGRVLQLDVSLSCSAEAIVLTFEDDGQPFDPLQQPEPALPKSLDAATLGGLGLLMVRKASTNLRYERTSEGKNRLTVTLAST